MTVFALPDLGEGLQEAEIVSWHVSIGEHVIADQPLVSVETDKAVVEIPAPFSGTVAGLLAEPGDVLPVGTPLAEIDTGATADTGAIVGEIGAPGPAPPERPAMPRKEAQPRPVPAAPGVRKLARERGVDLSLVTGTGPGGAILSTDVLAAEGSAEGEPLRGVRRSMARAMARSGAAVVPATLHDWADIHAWPPGEAPTPRLIRAIIAGCGAEPALNAHFDGDRRQMQASVEIAIAVDTPDGLFAPILRDAAGRTEVAAEILRLRRAVETRSLAPEELKGGTITLSNFGMLAGEYASLVVTPPQVAILGAGRIHDAVLAIDGTPALRRILPLSLTFDHRAVTGGEAARFLRAVRADLERADAS